MGMQETVNFTNLHLCSNVIMSFNTSYDFVSGNFYNSVLLKVKTVWNQQELHLRVHTK